MQYWEADWTFLPEGLQRGRVLAVQADGRIAKVLRKEDVGDVPVRRLEGLLCPGFVNAHCHLELSHLQGAVPRGTGMAGFVRQLQAARPQYSDAAQRQGAAQALKAMRERGIVAVGDICNGTSTAELKAGQTAIHFHNFVELFGMRPEAARDAFEHGISVTATLGPHSSLTLHAPYSISPALRDLVLDHAQQQGSLLSIHMLESEEETRLFRSHDGPLADMLQGFGLSFVPTAYTTPLDYICENFPADAPALFVHNTEISPTEFQQLITALPHLHFVLCPNANLYIHDKLPDATLFATAPDRICLGTDSLASNDALDIVSEMQTLQAHFGLDTELLLQWATINGARALGLPEADFEIRPGNRPRLFLLKGVDRESAILGGEIMVEPII